MTNVRIDKMKAGCLLYQTSCPNISLNIKVVD